MKTNKNENSIFGRSYKDIPIKADSRIHHEVFNYLKSNKFIEGNVNVLDSATGFGALAQRIIDYNPQINIDCNDLDSRIMTKGATKICSVDLNNNFDFGKKYDVILAVEIIEHLENPFHFIRNLHQNLKKDGIIILTTPNTDSFFDRLFFLIYGHHYYFGRRGIINSGGHITMCPEWLLRYIAELENMNFELVTNKISTFGLIGLRGKIILKLLSPIRYFIKNDNNRSGLVAVYNNKF
jgi:SAM-dependent methyltransferase